MIWVEYGWKYNQKIYKILIINVLAIKIDDSNIQHKSAFRRRPHWFG